MVEFHKRLVCTTDCHPLGQVLCGCGSPTTARPIGVASHSLLESVTFVRQCGGLMHAQCGVPCVRAVSQLTGLWTYISGAAQRDCP